LATSLENKENYSTTTIWVEGSKFNPFSLRINIRIKGNRDQIGVKVRSK